MKGLLLKDIYTIGHNTKSTLLLMAFIALCIIPTSNAYAYIAASSVIFCTMTITTFSIDEQAGFLKYAMVMPIRPQMYVLEKYVINLIFSLAGTLIGVSVFTVYAIVTRVFSFEMFIGSTLCGLYIALLFGSLYIPALFRFGAEQARFIMIGVAMVPTLALFLIYKLIMALGLVITSQHIPILLAIAIIMLLLIMTATYYYSLRCLQKKEF